MNRLILFFNVTLAFFNSVYVPYIQIEVKYYGIMYPAENRDLTVRRYGSRMIFKVFYLFATLPTTGTIDRI